MTKRRQIAPALRAATILAAALVAALTSGCSYFAPAADPQIVFMSPAAVDDEAPPECLARDKRFPRLPETPDGVDTEGAARDRSGIEQLYNGAVYRRAVCRRWLERKFPSRVASTAKP